MKALQKLGMLLFLVGVGFTLAVLFADSYTLSDQVIEKAVSDSEEQQQLKEILATEYGNSYSTSFSFQNAYIPLLESANEKVIATYAISEETIDRFISELDQSSITYQTDLWDRVLGSSEVEEFQKSQLKAYTSWMEGKSYASAEELSDQLNITRASINNDAANSKGFSGQRLKALKLAINRHASNGTLVSNPGMWLWLTLGLAIIGGLLHILPMMQRLPGINNNRVFQHPHTNRGWIGIIAGTLLITFYVILYWFPEHMTGWMILVDPLSLALNGNPASQWFFYGLLYTLAIGIMGVRMLIKYRHSKYQVMRTLSVMFFQTSFAFLIPELMLRLNMPSMDLKNIWPLNYTFFYDYNLEQLTTAGVVGTGMLGWGVALIVLGVPILTYFYGKRWYCSWVCGCGGLAETLGDPYRQLSDKSVKAWKIERWMIHAVLVFAVFMTIGVLYTYFTGSSSFLGLNTYSIRGAYGFLIGAAFAGVVGVGFYPFMGSRVWCRFGCPLAAYLGIVQRFKSRFRITTNGGQCISCGNCSTYCEMGIDVRWYAQRGQNIVRSSCVGCGVCSSVCPRGVLNLENTDEEGRLTTIDLTGMPKIEA